jgi:SNF2 family DNA or RNA helicase
LKFLGIRPLNDWQTFNEQIAKPVKAGRSVRAMKRLQVVLKTVMLRRRKDTLINGKALIELPARNMNIVQCEFDEDEQEFYSALENRVEETIQKYARSGDLMKSYTSVMVLLLRLRQGKSSSILDDHEFDCRSV